MTPVKKDIALIGIELAKTVYQLHAVNHKGQCVLKRKSSRSQLLSFIGQQSPCVIAMEACAGAHYFARLFSQQGHTVRLIAPQFVKPYVKGNKNDEADAEAIVEAAQRPAMRFVTPKAIWQQEVQTIHRIRQRLMRNRTALINETRAILYEHGIVVAQGPERLKKMLPDLLSQSLPTGDLSALGREILQSLYSELLELEEKIHSSEQRLKAFARQNSQAAGLKELRGMGLLGTTAMLAALGSPQQFKNGRHFSAYLGLVPRHQGSGGKNRLLGISKRGNSYLRSLLVHGARAQIQVVLAKAAKKEKLDPFNDWLYRLHLKKGWNKTAVALANKNARIAWALVTSEQKFDASKAAAAPPVKAAA